MRSARLKCKTHGVLAADGDGEDNFKVPSSNTDLSAFVEMEAA